MREGESVCKRGRECVGERESAWGREIGRERVCADESVGERERACVKEGGSVWERERVHGGESESGRESVQKTESVGESVRKTEKDRENVQGRERGRGRPEIQELYYTGIRVLGSCLFLQSVLANLRTDRLHRKV